MPDIHANHSTIIYLINTILTLISMVLSIVVFVVAFQVKHRSRRIRYFLSCIAICLGGLMFQIADYDNYAYVTYALIGVGWILLDVTPYPCISNVDSPCKLQ